MPKIVDGEVVYLSLLELTREMAYANNLRIYNYRDPGGMVTIDAVGRGVPMGKERESHRYNIRTMLGSTDDPDIFCVNLCVTSYPSTGFQKATALDDAETLPVQDDVVPSLFRFLIDLGTFNMHIYEPDEPPTGSRVRYDEVAPLNASCWRRTLFMCQEVLGAKRYAVMWEQRSAYIQFDGFSIQCDLPGGADFPVNGRVVLFPPGPVDTATNLSFKGVESSEDLARLASILRQARDKLELWKRTFEPVSDEDDDEELDARSQETMLGDVSNAPGA
jgi:hypothetical protein